MTLCCRRPGGTTPPAPGPRARRASAPRPAGHGPKSGISWLWSIGGDMCEPWAQAREAETPCLKMPLGWCGRARARLGSEGSVSQSSAASAGASGSPPGRRPEGPRCRPCDPPSPTRPTVAHGAAECEREHVGEQCTSSVGEEDAWGESVKWLKVALR